MATKKAEKANPLVEAAKTIGSAAGKVASLAGLKTDPPPAARAEAAPKKGKLQKKNKKRLPRRMKKAAKKAAEAAGKKQR